MKFKNRNYKHVGIIRLHYIERGYTVTDIESYWFFGTVFYFKYWK